MSTSMSLTSEGVFYAKYRLYNEKIPAIIMHAIFGLICNMSSLRQDGTSIVKSHLK